MQEHLKAQLEKFRTSAEECALLSKLAIDQEDRELFEMLAEHLELLADHVGVTIRLRDIGVKA